MKTFSKLPGSEPMREVSCAVCGEGKSHPYWKSDGFGYVKCSSCGLIYQNPQPLQNALSMRYDDEYFSYEINNEKPFFSLMKLGLKDIGFDEIEAQLLGEKSFLDIGCATGMLIADMKKRGWRVRGVEICRPAAEYGVRERGVDIFIGIFEEANFGGNSFDVIHASHLIEHLTDPAGFLDEVMRTLKPGGWFIVATPNVSGFQAHLFQERWRSAIADHTYLFSKATLSRLLRNRGFQIEQVKTWGGLAVGAGPSWVKRIADPLAKKTGLGDVMILRCRKPGIL